MSVSHSKKFSNICLDLPPPDPLDELAISDDDHRLLETFQKELDKVQMEECFNCGERWFDMNVNEDAICARCRQENNQNRFTKLNNLDPGPTIQELARENGLPIPEPLSQVEQVLLMPVHVMIQAYSVKGGQYKYSGHCCNFTRDIANIVTKLPQLPEDIDIIIVRSKSDDEIAEQVTSRRLHDAFQVKRSRVLANLEILQKFHPTFKDPNRVQIDHDALNSLPENGSVYDRLRNITEDSIRNDINEDQGPERAAADESDDLGMVSNSFVPQLNSEEREAIQLRNQLQPAEITLTQPVIRSTPINEHDPNLRYVIDAFAYLLPTGAADIHAEYEFGKIIPVEYFRHLLRWHDGRFARDPRFRYFALNSIMRWRAKTEARCYVSRRPEDGAMKVGTFF
jgi:hypothetical protein